MRGERRWWRGGRGDEAGEGGVVGGCGEEGGEDNSGRIFSHSNLSDIL